jgi:hypothetical protein
MTTEQAAAPDPTIEDIRELFTERGLTIATGDETEEARLMRILAQVLQGERTLEDVEASLDRAVEAQQDPFDIGSPPTEIGDATIPAGGRLVRITNPEGSDAAVLYRVVYEWNGVEYSYEIGDQERFDELFGDEGIAGFREYTRMDQGEWDETGIFVVGPIDERLGATESEASIMERELRALGFEQTPPWWDEEVSTIAVIGAAEGWSAGRIAKAMSETDAFAGRFPALAEFMAGRGITDLIAGTAGYVQEESALRDALNRFRGPTTDTSTEYLGSLISTGWTADQIVPVIEAERILRESPGAIDNLNEILAYGGLDTIDENGFIDVMTGSGSADVYEAINDTLRQQALLEAGVDIDTAFAESLGTGVSSAIDSPERYTQQAVQAATSIARNFRALDLQQYGLDRDDIVAAVFGEESPTGKTVGEINDILGKIQREAQASAAGYDSVQSFLDARGRLRIQGFSAT